MDGSQKYYDEQETDTKGYTRYDPIYIKWKKIKMNSCRWKSESGHFLG